MPQYVQPGKRGFVLYQRWPELVLTGGKGGVDVDFDAMTEDDINAVTESERNAVGGKIEASE